MNNQLTQQIVHHIFYNFGVLSQSNVPSLLNDNFLLKEKLSLLSENNETLNNNIYGGQVKITPNKYFKLLLVDCLSQDIEYKEYICVLQLDDGPIYGLYLLNYLNNVEEALIAGCKDQHWFLCNIYLQATFLAGMEQLKDINYTWTKCENYQELYQQLLTYVKYYNQYFEALNEGQEA